MHIAILIYDEVEVLDACGPFEVFSVAARLQKQASGETNTKVTLVSAYADREVIVARGGLRLTADTTIAQTATFDLLLVPGGVTTALEHDEPLMQWLRDHKRTPTIASVCTGAFLLAEAGILQSGDATTHWEDQAELAQRFPAINVLEEPRFVQQGNLYTSAGISAGIDLALHLTGLIDESLPARVARQMDYPYTPRA